MTLIIGARCRDGITLAGDRRVLRGTEYSEEKKIRLVFPNFIVGASGVSGLMDNFIRDMTTFIQSRGGRVAWVEFLNKLEDIIRQLYERYHPRLGADYQFDVLYAFKDTPSTAHLFYIDRRGFSQEIRTFGIIGHGQPHALPFVKALYNSNRTMQEINKLSTFILELVDKHNVDLSVGGKPQIFNVPYEGDTKELSEEEIDNLIKEVSPTGQKLLESLNL